MKRIAYIELDTHAEIAAAFLALMQDSKDFQTDFFLSKKIAAQLPPADCIRVINDFKTLPPAVRRGNYDLVILGTVHRNFNIFKSICRAERCAVIVHNLNFSRIRKTALLRNIFKKEMLYRLKLLLKEGLLSAPGVYRNADFRLVLDAGLKTRDGVYLPVFFRDARPDKPAGNTIVVPGAVSPQRRDYARVLEKIKTFRHNFEVIFAGRASGKALEMLQVAEKNLPEHIKIRYFSEKIPQGEFGKILADAGLLWCPIRRETEFFSVREIYGETKMSGNVGDAIRSGRPAVFPTFYASSIPLIINEIEDTEAQFLDLIKNVGTGNYAEFSKEAVRSRLEKVLKTLC